MIRLKNTNTNPTLEEIVSLCKRRGFVFPTSEIYGGLASAYDYGPIGVQLLKNIKDLWWKKFIIERQDMVGLDSQIILHPKTWEASGHVSNFADPMVEDKKTHKRYRADHIIEAYVKENSGFEDIVVENMDINSMGKFIKYNNIKSPERNDITDPKPFNSLVETRLGVIEGEKNTAYLRGETAQGIFSNFNNIMSSSRVSLPFGVGQIGKSFRNEITLGQFIFRTFEFEQAEIEYFFDPEKENWQELLESWKIAMWEFVTKALSVKSENLRWRKHTDKERSHYSKDTYDLEYKFPFGFKELWGIAYRTDYDLKQHMKYSKEDMQVLDSETGRKFVPHVIEPAVGINRLLFMAIADSYSQEAERLVLRFNIDIAPYQVAVFPLVKNKPEIVKKAKEIYQALINDGLRVAWDDRGNIGKRYYAQDEIGTPKCITVDYQTLEDGTVTERDRDTMEQKRVTV